MRLPLYKIKLWERSTLLQEALGLVSLLWVTRSEADRVKKDWEQSG